MIVLWAFLAAMVLGFSVVLEGVTFREWLIFVGFMEGVVAVSIGFTALVT